MLKVNPGARRLSNRGCAMAPSMTPQSGPIYVPSMVTSAEEWWASLRQVSLVSPIAPPARDEERLMSVTSGPIPSDSSARWDPSSCCWRTSQASFLEMEANQLMGARWSESWPKQGMTVNGRLYPLPTQERHTSANAGGVWPTPDASVANDGESVESWERRRLKEKAKHRNGNGFGNRLTIEVQKWPTPTGRDHKDGDAHSCQNVPVNGLLGRAIHTDAEEAHVLPSGSLNPRWVEWLMGVPIGWVSLDALPPERYAEWRNAESWWAEEPPIPRVCNGTAHRVSQLRALGNGVVPAAVAEFLRTVAR